MSDRTNDEWVRQLSAPPPENTAAIDELRALITKKLRHLLGRGQAKQLSIVEDIAQETIMKVLDRLDTFRGESLFTTWVSRIAINLAYSELRRRRWRDVSLDVLPAELFSFDPESISSRHDSPEKQAIESSIVEALNHAIRTALTDYQRQVLVATLRSDLPMGEVAERFGTNRNALYKVLHDARMKLKETLVQAGISKEDITALR